MYQFRQGEKHAFERVFRLYYAPLVFFTVNIISDQSEGEDIVTDVFISLYNKRSSFQNEENVRAYLYVSARNRCYNYLSAKTRHGINPLDNAGEVQDDNMLAYEHLIRAEMLQALHDAIEGLPEVCRKIFKMSYYESLSAHEVAKKLNLANSTVYVQKMRAINMLRKKLAGIVLVIEWLMVTIKMIFF